MSKILDLLSDKYKDQRWFAFLEELIYRYETHGVSEIGAQMTYYLILSIFPFVIFFLNILKFTPLSNNMALSEILAPLPVESQKLLADLIKEIMNTSSMTLLSFGALGAIWSSSQGIMSVIKSVNRALDLKEDRPYWKLRGLSIIFTFGLFFALLVSLFVLVFGEIFFNMIFISYTWPSLVVWKIVKLVVPLGFMILTFSLLYKLAPSIKQGVVIKYKDTLPGSLFTSIGWIISSIIFSFYINNFGNYAKTYGSIGGLIILLIWIYISSIIIVLGAEVNATLISLKDRDIKN